MAWLIWHDLPAGDRKIPTLCKGNALRTMCLFRAPFPSPMQLLGIPVSVPDLALKAVLLTASTVGSRLLRFAQFLCNVSPFRINTSKSVLRQTTLTPFRMNTYEKSAGGGCISSFLQSFARHVPRDSSPFASCSCALFCTLQKPTLLFSSNSALSRKNTRGWGAPLLNALLNRRSPRPVKALQILLFQSTLSFPP